MTNGEFLKLQIAAMKSSWFQEKVRKILKIERAPTHLEIAIIWEANGHADRFRRHFEPYLLTATT